MARHRAWTQDIDSPAEVALIREISREGISLIVCETDAEWRAHSGSFGIRKPTATRSGAVRQGWTALRIRSPKRMRTGGFDDGVFESVNEIMVWSKAKMEAIHKAFPHMDLLPWGRIVAHELAHIYWARDFGTYTANSGRWSHNARLQEMRRVFKAKQGEIEAAFGHFTVQRAVEFASYYPPDLGAEEVLVEIVAEVWWREAAGRSKAEDISPVREVWEVLRSILALQRW